VPQGHNVALKARVRFEADVEDPVVSLYLLNEDHIAVAVATTIGELEHTGSYDPGEEAVFSFAFMNVLGPGRYNPLVTLAHRGSGLDLMDRYEGAASFVVTGHKATGGLVDLPFDVTIGRARKEASEEVGA
jgi:Wzt-like putative exopolysaccharide export protein